MVGDGSWVVAVALTVGNGVRVGTMGKGVAVAVGVGDSAESGVLLSSTVGIEVGVVVIILVGCSVGTTVVIGREVGVSVG